MLPRVVAFASAALGCAVAPYLTNHPPKVRPLRQETPPRKTRKSPTITRTKVHKCAVIS